MSWLRTLILKRELDRNLRARKVVRKARQEAAYRGQSTETHRRFEQCQRVFGE